MHRARENKGKNSKQEVSLFLHRNWCFFIQYCEKIKYGEIQNLKIQDGLPQIAEVVKKKINFSKGEGSQT
jgi:hypothetical protein